MLHLRLSLTECLVRTSYISLELCFVCQRVEESFPKVGHILSRIENVVLPKGRNAMFSSRFVINFLPSSLSSSLRFIFMFPVTFQEKNQTKENQSTIGFHKFFFSEDDFHLTEQSPNVSHYCSV